ncbi:MAG TPA: DUF927 domain-containing protein [Patescibacteria group bacterium]|nr:DUF927 domain-containing protein [Patescibacteria group bacterium]
MNAPDHRDGVAILAATVDQIAADGGETSSERQGPLIDLLSDCDLFGRVVDAYLTRGAEVEAQCMRLGAVLTATAAGLLRSRLKEEKRDREKRRNRNLRVVDDHEEAITVREASGWDDYPPGVTVPSGWRLDDDGLHRLRVSDGQVHLEHVGVPLLITSRLVDADDGSYSVELAWLDGYEWKRERVPRSVALDSRALVRLADQGLPVSSSSARRLVEWLTRLDQQAAIPTITGAARMGWVGRSRSAYLLGDLCIQPFGQTPSPTRYVPSSAGARQLAESIAPLGTWEGWCDAVRVVADRPHAFLAMYAAAAAPFLRILDAPNFGVDFAGDSSSGKSTVLEFGVSTYGMPRNGRGYRSWGATLAGAEGTAGILCDLPLALNEGQLVKPQDRPAAGALLYALAEGSSRAKGALGRLGLAHVDDWRTVVISTSEEGITNWAPTDGVRARILVVHGAPMRDKKQADDLVAAIRQHHGHLYPRILDRLVGLTHEQVDGMRAAYRRSEADYAKDATTRIAGRAAKYMATIGATAAFVHAVGCPKPEGGADATLAWIWQQVLKACGEADQALRALETTWAWIGSNGEFFHSPDSVTKPPPGGWLGWKSSGGDYWLCSSAHLRRVLQQAGFGEPGTIFRQWAARGWTKTAKGRTDYRMPVQPPNLDTRPTGIALLAESQDAMDGLDER